MTTQQTPTPSRATPPATDQNQPDAREILRRIEEHALEQGRRYHERDQKYWFFRVLKKISAT